MRFNTKSDILKDRNASQIENAATPIANYVHARVCAAMPRISILRAKYSGLSDSTNVSKAAAASSINGRAVGSSAIIGSMIDSKSSDPLYD